MLNGVTETMFIDTWAWAFFVGAGLVLVILELLVGIDTGLDMVFIGSAFVLGGLVAIPLHSWVWAALVTGIICIVYVFLGRRYIHRRTAVKLTQTNIDTIIGKRGVVLGAIDRNTYGLVKVGHEEWRAHSEESIAPGEEITVTGVTGVTLTVEKSEGSQEQ